MQQRKPLSRNDCTNKIQKAVWWVFSASGARPDFKHNPRTYSPRLEPDDIDVLEKSLFDCLAECRKSVLEDKNLPFAIPQYEKKKTCPCCGDDGSDGARDFEKGSCQKCIAAGCAEKCVRPPEHTPFYNPGDDAPHGWGSY